MSGRASHSSPDCSILAGSLRVLASEWFPCGWAPPLGAPSFGGAVRSRLPGALFSYQDCSIFGLFDYWISPVTALGSSPLENARWAIGTSVAFSSPRLPLPPIKRPFRWVCFISIRVSSWWVNGLQPLRVMSEKIFSLGGSNHSLVSTSSMRLLEVCVVEQS